MGFKEDFIKKTKMRDVNDEKTGVKEVMDYLVKPESVFKMIIASEMGLPVLTLIGRDLEKKFDKHSNFPVVYLGNDKNPTARQNVGRMVKVLIYTYINFIYDAVGVIISCSSKFFNLTVCSLHRGGNR